MRRSGQIRPGGHLRSLSGRQERGEARPRPRLGLRPCPRVSDSCRRRPGHRKIKAVGHPHREGAGHGDSGNLEDHLGGAWRRGKREDT